MSRTSDLARWQAQVQEIFPDLTPSLRRTLAEYSYGLVLAGCCGLSSVVAHLALLLGVALATIKARLRELYLPADARKGSPNTAFDHTLCFGPLLRWAVAGQPEKRLALALDPTPLSDRFCVLCVSVLYQGFGLPVAWAVRTADATGSWNDIWKDLLGRLHQELGEDYEVLVLTDRGLESATLFRAITALDWHPLMRVKASGTFQPTGWHKGYAMRKFAAGVGRRWAGTGVAYPSSASLPCTLLADWEAGHEEAWLILTDLPPRGTNVAWYAWRMWCEQGYRTVKRGQWQWQRTQMQDPGRAERLWTVICLASLWAVDVGAHAEATRLSGMPKKRELSLLKQGLMVLTMARRLGEAMPMPRRDLEQHPWPEREWESDARTEKEVDGC